jgi:aspartate/methionine/tyrosine aminotransferase
MTTMSILATSTEVLPSLANSHAVSLRSSFARLAELLAGVAPGKPAINLAAGEPQHPIPSFVGPVIAAHLEKFGRYPNSKGTEKFRHAAAGWLGRRYRLKRPVNVENEIVVLSGTREGLFLAAIAAKQWVRPRKGRPAILIPNPFYAPYAAAAIAAGCETVYLAATPATGFLPDLEVLDDELLARTVAIYLSSPANPQGSVADLAYLAKLAALARRFGFVVFSDECYSEIYWKQQPTGILEAAGPGYANVVSFHSISKRSSMPGLRVGFAAGDRGFITSYMDLRNVSAPLVPMPLQEVAVAAFTDETHVEENRSLYAAKFDLADQIVGDRFGYRRPAGGFYLWLNVATHGGGEPVTVRLWREAGICVLPGGYMASDHIDGTNPGADYIRVALVHDKETTANALHRLVAVLH